MQQKTPQPISLLLLGAPGSGKTSIAKRLTHHRVDAAYKPTTGVTNFASSENHPLKLTVWDAGGAKRNRSVTQTYLHHKSLSAIGLVLDSSAPLDDEMILDWLDFLQAKPASVPVFVLFNKVDLMNKKNRNQQKALWIQKVQTLLAQKTFIDCTITLRFCSAKTGEGIEAAFEALFAGQTEKKKSEQTMHPVIIAPPPIYLPLHKADPPDLADTDKSTQAAFNKRSRHRVKKKENTNKPHPVIVAPEPVSLPFTHEPQSPQTIESPQPVSVFLMQVPASTLPLPKQLSNFNWRKAIRKWLKNNRWRSGNLLIFILTLSLFVFTLLPAAGALSMVSVLPLWVVCLLLGGLVLVGWNIGCALYDHTKQVPSQTIREETEINGVSENNDNFPHKKERLTAESNLFYASYTSSVPAKPTSSPSTPCQNSSNPNS